MYILILTTTLPGYGSRLNRLKSVGPFPSADAAQQYALDQGFLVDVNLSLLWKNYRTHGVKLILEARIIQMLPPDGSLIVDPG